MNGLVKRSDVIETANKFSFTDENDRRRYLDFLDYCLKETKTAYDVDAVVEELEKEKRPLKEAVVANRISISINNELIKIKNSDIDKYIAMVRKGGVNE